MIYLILLFTILFFLLAWWRLDWAVMFLIAALPAYLIRFTVLGLPSTLLEVMIWAIFIVWFLKNYRFVFKSVKLKIENWKLKINNRYPFDWEIILLLLIALAAAGVAGFSPASLGIWKAYFFEPALFFIVIFNVMAGMNGREKILWSLLAGAATVSLLAVYQKITGQLIGNPEWANAATRRAVSFFGYPNAVGLYLAPVIMVLTGWLADVIAGLTRNLGGSFSASNSGFRLGGRNDRLKIIFISLSIILSLLAVYFAKSKGALLGIAAAALVFGLMAGKKARLAALGIIILLVAAIALYQPAWNLAESNLTLTNKSGQIRKAGWSDTWRMLKDGRLITGAGLANFQKAVAPYHTPGIFIKDYNDPDWLKKIRASADFRQKSWQPLEIYLYPHNISLNFWSELGLAGLLLFVWIILKYIYLGVKNYESTMKSEKYLNIGLIAAMVAIVVQGLVDVPYFKNDLAVMFWLFVAMISMIRLEMKSVNNLPR